MLEMHLGEEYAMGYPAPPDDYGHWCLTHFLLDGHHKLEAPPSNRRPFNC
jgi:hypothetical protein